MRLRGWAICALVCLLSDASLADAGLPAELRLTPDEIAQAVSHGPWPLPDLPDPSNRVSGNPDAIALGRALFFSTKLSQDRETSCASCHKPERNFADGLSRGQGVRILDRNTLALQNLQYGRWFGWDGKTDNLWAQSILPMVHPDEMALTPDDLRKILTNPEFAEPYRVLFGAPEQNSAERNLVNTGKLLAAYQETLKTGSTAFDHFRDALAAQDWESAATYPAAAQRGLSLFIGRGNCGFCHAGALFTNGEFHDAGVPYFIEPGRVDSGRHGGIKELKSNPFTLDSEYSDDPAKIGAWAAQQVAPQHANFGTFRVPGLRNVARTAPYMHNGSLKTLEEVVRHYSDIDLERLHADGELILRPLALTQSEIDDLVTFLETLTSEDPNERRHQ